MSVIMVAVNVKRNNHLDTNLRHSHLLYCFINEARSFIVFLPIFGIKAQHTSMVNKDTGRPTQ